MRKSKIFVLVSLCLIIALFVSFFGIYNWIFPKAPPIEVPEPYQDMTIVQISPDGTRSEYFVDGSLIVADGHLSFLMLLENAEPTRIMSVNDYPEVPKFHTVSYICKDKTYTYYIYEDNGITYVEIPYVGVYEL